MSNFTNRKIIIIDDDTRIHEDFRKILGDSEEMSEYDAIEASLFSQEVNGSLQLKYELESAYQGEEGYNKILKAKEENNPFAMAFVDMRMPPGWDGLETIKRIWDVDTNIQLVICTAYSDYSWNEVLYHLGASDRLLILKKPFDMVEVQQIATALTTKWNLSCESISRLKMIRESEEKYRTVIDSVEDSIMTLNKKGDIIFVNHNPWHMIKQAVGGNYYLGIKDEYRDSVINSVNDVFETGEQRNVEYASDAEDESTVWSEGRISPLYKNDEVVAATLVASDISVRKALDWQLRHDELTGLSNRTFFSTYIETCVSESAEGSLFALLFIDLDHFNLINDCFGHDIGDKLLIKLSEILSEKINKKEMIARFGGDEFSIFKCLGEGQVDVHEYAESLNELLKEPLEIEGFDIYTTASIGIVLFGKETSITNLFRNADAALCHAKAKGRNRYEYFDQKMNDRVVKRVKIGNELRRAIEDNQLEVYYQPLTDLKLLKVTAFEALIRWNHPVKGMVSPVEFIHIAEETGMIFQITHLVLEMVCKQIKVWSDMGVNNINVAVNCSARDFNEQKLQAIIEKIINETGADINRLDLELTEGSIMDDVEAAIENMRKLSEMGINISIDDFGTGYSSFSHIKHFAIDKLKIDRTFIKDTPQDEDDVAIVEAIIAMAKRLKIKVVAEGVETPEQLAYLKKANCDVIQGYLLGKPMPAAEATRRLKDGDWPNQDLL